MPILPTTIYSFGVPHASVRRYTHNANVPYRARTQKPRMEAFERQNLVKTMSKYKAVRTVVDGVNFASKLEAKRYGELRLLEKAGAISDLVLQARFPLSVDGVIIGSYVCDFLYMENGKKVVEDCKGVQTDLYRWKKKHFNIQYHPLAINEITRQKRL